MSGRRPARVTAQQTTPPSTTPTRAAKVFHYVTHATSTLTLQPAGGGEQASESGSDSQVSIWSHLLLWLPYALFTLFLVALVVASFVSFHRKNGHKYRRRRSEIWRDLDMHSLFENMHQAISPPPHALTDQSNGGHPELQSLLATCPPPPPANKHHQQQAANVKPAKRKEPIKFAANANGSMIDVRYADRAPPPVISKETGSNASSSAFALVHVRSSKDIDSATMMSSNDVTNSNQRTPFDVVTSFSEPHQPNRPAEYKTRKVDKKLSRSRTSADGGDDRDDVIRLVLRGHHDNDVVIASSSSQPLPPVTQSARPGPVKSLRTLPSSPAIQALTSRGRQLPQPPLRL